MKRPLAIVLLAMALPGMAHAEVEGFDWTGIPASDWPACDDTCAVETIKAAQSVVIFHKRGAMTKPEAQALVGAVQRGARVSVFVGEDNDLSSEVIWYVRDIYHKWAETADDDDVSMLGMTGCVMGKTAIPGYIVTDPFGTKPNDVPAFIVGGQKTTNIQIAADASVVSETEDFIQCQLNYPK
jgi:hypothetical protein